MDLHPLLGHVFQGAVDLAIIILVELILGEGGVTVRGTVRGQGQGRGQG